MKSKLWSALASLVLVLPFTGIAQDAGTNAAPAIPEEARKHFVMGGTMFKEAKGAEDFTLAAKQFTQAADLVPQWPEARYNLALAEEAAGDYTGALADLKRYQAFKLTDAEARTVQDKIYAVEAKQQMAQTDGAKKKDQETKTDSGVLLNGIWRCTESDRIDPGYSEQHSHGKLYPAYYAVHYKIVAQDQGVTITEIDEVNAEPSPGHYSDGKTHYHYNAGFQDTTHASLSGDVLNWSPNQNRIAVTQYKGLISDNFKIINWSATGDDNITFRMKWEKTDE